MYIVNISFNLNSIVCLVGDVLKGSRGGGWRSEAAGLVEVDTRLSARASPSTQTNLKA